MAEPSESQPRFTARSGYVGGGRFDPPLSDKGPGRVAFDLPPVLRTLHAHGSGWQRRPPGREAEVSDSAERPLPTDAGVPEDDPVGARRGGERRRHRQYPDRGARGVLFEIDGYPERPGYSSCHVRI